MDICARYFRNVDGSLRAEPIPGRCGRYWDLWLRRHSAQQALALRPDQPRLGELIHTEQELSAILDAHLGICPTCRAWMDRLESACEENVPVFEPSSSGGGEGE